MSAMSVAEKLKCVCGESEADLYRSGDPEFHGGQGLLTRQPVWCGECERLWWLVEPVFGGEGRRLEPR